MPTIKGPFTIKKRELLNKNKKFMSIVENHGMQTPFDEREGKTTFSNKKAKKVKISKYKKRQRI